MIKIIITNTYTRTSKPISHVRHTATNRPSKNYIPLFTNPFSAHFYINQLRIRIVSYLHNHKFHCTVLETRSIPITFDSRQFFDRFVPFHSVQLRKKNYIL